MLMRRVFAILLTTMIAASIAGPAMTKEKKAKKVHLVGVVTEGGVDDDGETEDTLTVLVLKMNGAGSHLLADPDEDEDEGDDQDEGDVEDDDEGGDELTVTVDDDTRFKGCSPSDLGIGDRVRIEATRQGDTLVAGRVRLMKEKD